METECTWDGETELKFTTRALQLGEYLFAVLSHKVFIKWEIAGSLSEGKRVTPPSKTPMAQLHSSGLANYLVVVFCDGSVSLLETTNLRILEIARPPSSESQFETSQLIQTKKENLLVFVLTKLKKGNYALYVYKIVPASLSIELKYTLEIPQSKQEAKIISCSFERRSLDIHWNTGFWERYNVTNGDLVLAKSLLITTPIILPTHKGKKKVDQFENMSTALNTQAQVSPSSFLILNDKEGGPTLTLWSLFDETHLHFDHKLPVSNSKKEGNTIKQLYRSRKQGQFFVVLENEIFVSNVVRVGDLLSDVIGKAEHTTTTKPTLCLDDYLNGENEKVGNDPIELEIADAWRKEIEKKNAVEEKFLSSLVSSKSSNEFDKKMTEYLNKSKQSGVPPSYSFFTKAVTHCVEKEFWEPLNSLLLLDLITTQMVPKMQKMLSKTIQRKNIKLIHSILNHLKHIPSEDVFSILKFLLAAENEGLIKQYVKTVSNGSVYSEQESLYFLLDDLVLVPLQHIPQIDDLTLDETTILLTYFQSRFKLYFSQVDFKDTKHKDALSQKHDQQPLSCILFWFSEVLNTKFLNLLTSQESFLIVDNIHAILKNQTDLGVAFASFHGSLSHIKTSLSKEGRAKEFLILSQDLYKLETWPEQAK